MKCTIVLQVISVTSFNEWGEGTQIEPAAELSTLTTITSASSSNHQGSDNSDVKQEGYIDYGTGDDTSFLYLNLTSMYAKIYLGINSQEEHKNIPLHNRLEL